MKWLIVGAAICMVGIGSASAQPPPPPTYAPIPPPRAEVVPPPPGGPMVWEPGHWHWDGYRYVWRPGHYVQRRAEYGHYVEGRWIWAPREGRWIWRPAHWE
jgi:WXXGXW repeat (2 copies)